MNIQRKVAWIAGKVLLIIASSPALPVYADGIRDSQWYLRRLGIAQSREITTGGGILVAVIDTGVYPHRDVRRNLVDGIDEATGSGNGMVDDVGHGTGMASLIAGHGASRNSGILGIAPAAKILPVRVVKADRNIPAPTMAKGIEWAATHKAKIINVSAGSGPAFELEDAIIFALRSDVVVIAAVGNSSGAAIISYPAALNGVLAVGATGRNGEYSPVSVKDPKVQICAPGVDITTARPKNSYVVADGTSAATAIVSGAAALVRARFPRLSAEEVIHRLTATADDIGPPGRDDECGFGRLNIIKALTANVPPLTPSTTATPPTTASPTPPASSASSARAAPQTTPTDSPGTAIAGILAGLVAAGGVVALLVARRRRGY